MPGRGICGGWGGDVHDRAGGDLRRCSRSRQPPALSCGNILVRNGRDHIDDMHQLRCWASFNGGRCQLRSVPFRSVLGRPWHSHLHGVRGWAVRDYAWRDNVNGLHELRRWAELAVWSAELHELRRWGICRTLGFAAMHGMHSWNVPHDNWRRELGQLFAVRPRKLLARCRGQHSAAVRGLPPGHVLGVVGRQRCNRVHGVSNGERVRYGCDELHGLRGRPVRVEFRRCDRGQHANVLALPSGDLFGPERGGLADNVLCLRRGSLLRRKCDRVHGLQRGDVCGGSRLGHLHGLRSRNLFSPSKQYGFVEVRSMPAGNLFKGRRHCWNSLQRWGVCIEHGRYRVHRLRCRNLARIYGRSKFRILRGVFSWSLRRSRRFRRVHMVRRRDVHGECRSDSVHGMRCGSIFKCR